jgi:Domain of unknown function (DUF4159)
MIFKKPAGIPAEWIDEIPTRPSAFKARVVCVSVIMLAGLAGLAFQRLPGALDGFLSSNGDLAILMQKSHATTALKSVFQGFGILALLCVLAGAAGFFRHPFTRHALSLPLYLTYLLAAAYAWLVWRAGFGALAANITISGSVLDTPYVIGLWWAVTWPVLAAAAYAGWVHVMLRSRSVHAAFTREEGAPMPGDRVLEDLRTHGRDRRNRLSIYASVFTHVLILFIIPWMLSFCGNVEAYKLPKGSGEPVVAVVKMVKPKKKKKQKLTLRANSAILYDQPDLDDTVVDQQMEEQTKATYMASNAKAGKMGKGGGKEGGWPEGMEDYKIRFIRLEHSGAGWDDGMDETYADINFLRAFAEATGFKKIANKGESHSIALLKKYPKDGFPPFVYLTGNADMGRVSTDDIKILRDYCLNGGLLIADAGSARFHQSFTHFMRQVFPDKPLVDIADDEMVYQIPFGFPDGAPAFWHHGGRRALGVKHEGRWCVFYHPGDMNDAWKSQAYTDVTPEMRDAAMNLGINLVYYAFNQWNDAVAKEKK